MSINTYNRSEDDRETRFLERVAEFLESDDDQRVSVRAQVVMEFPEHADQIDDFLVAEQRLDELVAPLLSIASDLPEIMTDDRNGAGSVTSWPELPDYEILEFIARGGMGVVYKARQKSLDRIVAVKMMRSAELPSEVDVRKFREEAQRIAHLDHPHIVPVYEIGDEGGRPYFTMRLMERGSLARRMIAGKIPVRDAVRIVVEIARAVHFAHQRGILHRDVKPGNILFDSEDRPQIGDFGLAQQIDREALSMHSMAIVGTPMYMAPEQAKRRGALTTAVDVYGLGVVLYEMISGLPPFRADTPLNTLIEVLQREPKSPRTLNHQIDIDLETICMKCIEKEPEHRYGTAEALAEDLERWLRNEPVLARRALPWQRLIKWAKRSPAIAAASLLAIVAVCISIIVLGVTNVRVAEEARQKSLALQKEQLAVEDKTAALEDLKAAQLRDRRLSYFQSIALAERELVAGNVKRVEQILESCPQELRSWEWNFLKRSCHAEVQSVTTPNEPGRLVCDPHHDRIYVAGGVLGKSGYVCVFEPDTTNSSKSGSSSVDGPAKRESLWEGSGDSQVVPDPRTIYSTDDTIVGVALSPDAQRLMVISGRTATMLATQTGNVLVQLPRFQDNLNCVAFSPNGSQIALAGAGQTIVIWDLEQRQELRTFTSHKNVIWSVAFSPDGRQIASASSDRTIKLWDVSTGDCLQTFEGHTELVHSVSFDSEGNRLLSAGYDNTARVWNPLTGTELAKLSGHTSFVTNAAFSPDDQRIATSSVDGTLRIWDSESGELISLLRRHDRASWDVAWRSSGRQLVSVGEDRMCKIWKAIPHDLLQTLGDRHRFVKSMIFSTSGNRLGVVLDNKRLAIWNTSDVTQQIRISGEYDVNDQSVKDRRVHDQPDNDQLAFSHDGRILASRDSPDIKTLATDDGKLIRKIKLTESSRGAIALSDDGRVIALEESNGMIRLCDLPGAEESPSDHDHRIQVSSKLLSLTFIHHSDWLAGVSKESNEQGQVTIWNIRSGKTISHFGNDIRFVRFSSDGSLTATCENSNVIRVWETATGNQQYSIENPQRAVRALAFSPAADRLFFACGDGTITIWDAQTQHEILSIRDSTSPIDQMSFPDGSTLLGISRAGAIQRWISNNKNVANPAQSTK